MARVRLTALLALTVSLAGLGGNSRAQEVETITTTGLTGLQQSLPVSAGLTTEGPQATHRGDTERDAEQGSRSRPPAILPDKFMPSHLASRAMAVMGLLIVACIGAIWYGQRFSRPGRLSRSSSTDLQVVESLSIAPRCCVHLLRVGGQKYLVARDQAGIKSVTAVSAFAASLDDLADSPVDTAYEAATPSMGNESWAKRSDPWTGSRLNR